MNVDILGYIVSLTTQRKEARSNFSGTLTFYVMIPPYVQVIIHYDSEMFT